MTIIDYNRARRVMHQQLLKFGGVGFVIRGDVRTPFVMAISQYSKRERGLYLDTSLRITLSALNSQTPPDFELDMIEFKKRVYSLNSPAEGVMPDGSYTHFQLNDCLYRETVA